jgi:hypothetical protein
MVPEHLRAGYRLRRNADFLPPELAGAAIQPRNAARPVTRLTRQASRQPPLVRLPQDLAPVDVDGPAGPLPPSVRVTLVPREKPPAWPQ